jgi:hypothetical protein
MRAIIYHQSPSTVKTAAAGDGEDPSAVIKDIGFRLRSTRTPEELHSLRAAAERDFRARRATFSAVGGLDYAGPLDDAPVKVRSAYIALVAALSTMATIDCALDPVDPMIVDSNHD